MTDEKKTLKVEFAPGCFDAFEGTQEELDKMVAELQEMFANMTPEELAARSRPLELEDLEDMDPDQAEAILAAIDRETGGRNLQ